MEQCKFGLKHVANSVLRQWQLVWSENNAHFSKSPFPTKIQNEFT
jgi:hypothetical protein